MLLTLMLLFPLEGCFRSGKCASARQVAALMQDEVRPISCRGHDSQGGVAITLVDALDTLLVRMQVRKGLFILSLHTGSVGRGLTIEDMRTRRLECVGLQVMDNEEQLVRAVHWLDANLSFDLDARVHVFELTIRALGMHLGHFAYGFSMDPLMRRFYF